ncbi:MAG: 1-acyl-sn-glycerol-3-phosphate acyltransferase [Chitinophagales bacterium]|nr:1-acyl-sn-glycerol-3-phosphate acyltransferase [Chitinophagales bacterium]
MKQLFIWIFKLKGWKLATPLPPGTDRCVMIASPHTSNWDLIFTIACFELMRIPLKFTIKHEWLKWPFKRMMEGWGAIGIDRSPKQPGQPRPSMVEVMTDLFKDRDRIALVVTPEGTRSLRTSWKTGFYHVAVNANVPIALGYLDYKKKEAGVGKVIYPSGDMAKDMKEIMEFYVNIAPKFPEKFSVDVDYLKGTKKEAAQA